jgi:hypothetical protein
LINEIIIKSFFWFLNTELSIRLRFNVTFKSLLKQYRQEGPQHYITMIQENSKLSNYLNPLLSEDEDQSLPFKLQIATLNSIGIR